MIMYCNYLCVKHYCLSVEPDNLQACHHMKKKYQVIIKFKYIKQKHRVSSNSKILQNKSLELTQLKFSGKLFINESMCHENHQFAHKYCQLRIVFFFYTFDIKLAENEVIHKIFHQIDMKKVWGFETLDEYINNVSF